MRRLLITLCLMSGVAAGPVMAQSDVIDLRVGKLEKEMKAVQRKVFPGGAALEPELGGQPATILPAGTAANTPISDLTARVDALESQLKSITGQQEQYGFHQKKQDELIKAGCLCTRDSRRLGHRIPRIRRIQQGVPFNHCPDGISGHSAAAYDEPSWLGG